MDAPDTQESAAIEKSGIPALAAAPRGVYGPDDRPYERVVPIVFVGGTGRSGTHVVARFLGRHNKIAAIPVECRFHTEPGGFPGLLAGEVSKEKFIRRMGGFW